MNGSLMQALRYLRNTGDGVTEAQFDDDHEPIGPKLRDDMKGLYELDERGIMKLTEEGHKACMT